MSQGTLTQLGALSVFETSMGAEPPRRMFDQCVKRHSRFALEEHAEVFPNYFYFGQTNILDIPRSGDLLGNLTLQLTLPAIPDAGPTDTWVPSIGYVLLRRIRLLIDDTVVHDDERLWYDLSDRLFCPQELKDGLDEMIGRKQLLSLQQAHTLFIPLKLLCCKGFRTWQNFFPLLGIPSSVVRLELHTETFDKCVASYSGSHPIGTSTPLDATLLIQYAMVESYEKERIINRPEPFLYEGVQDMESLSYKDIGGRNSTGQRMPVDRVRIDLSELNAPVKQLVWVSYPTVYESYFEYTDDTDDTRLLLNGNERFTTQPTQYFSILEKYYRTSNTKRDNVKMYSFALKADEWHPSGALNFDAVVSPVLECRMKEPKTNVTVKVFAVAYRRLIFANGQARLEFI